MREAISPLENILLFPMTQEPIPPLEVRNQNGSSEILARAHKDGKKHVIAHTFDVADILAKSTAEMFVEAMNKSSNARDLIASALSALELCLNSGGLSWEAEQEAECVSSKIRQSGILK